MRRKTNEQFKQEVYDIVGNEYTFLEPYVNNKTKIKVKHNKCGHVYEVRPASFLDHQTRCPYCSSSAKKTDKEFKQEVFNLVGNEYTFLDSYVNTMTKLKVKHNKCGHVYEIRPVDFLRGVRCSYCFGTHKRTDTQFRQEVKNLVGDEYTFLDHYVNATTKIRVKHNKCGHIYGVTPGNFLKGSRCSYCFGNYKKTDDQFKKEVFDLIEDEYTFLDSYVNTITKLRVKHNQCGNTYKVKPNDFLQGCRCPYCNSPKGETIINKILKSLKINYEYQKTFDDLKDNSLLSYDFYIPDQDILIEYQGIQHYQPIDYFGGDTIFKRQQRHDKMKAEYAKSHHYNLIDVPYTEDTFNKIEKYLVKHGLKLIA